MEWLVPKLTKRASIYCVVWYIYLRPALALSKVRYLLVVKVLLVQTQYFLSRITHSCSNQNIVEVHMFYCLNLMYGTVILNHFPEPFFLEIHIHICAKPNYKWYLDLSWTVHCYIGWTNILYDTPFPRFPEVAFLLECHLGWCSGCGNKLDGVNRIDKPTRSANCAYRVLFA